MPLVGVVSGVRPPIMSSLRQPSCCFFFFFQIRGVVPKPVVLQGLPVPLVVFAPLRVVCCARTNEFTKERYVVNQTVELSIVYY